MNTRSDQVGPVSRWVVATAIAGTVGIALGAFWLSFTSLSDLVIRAGIAESQAWVWPLIVDGIIVVATVSAVALTPYGRRATWYPWALLTAGAIVSVTANAAHAIVTADNTVPAVLAAAVSAVPPLVLLAITHLTVELTRRTRTSPADVTLSANRQTAHIGDDEPHVLEPKHSRLPGDQVPTPGPARRELAQAHREAGWSNKQIARELRVHPSTVGRWFTTVDETSSAADHPQPRQTEQGILTTHR